MFRLLLNGPRDTVSENVKNPSKKKVHFKNNFSVSFIKIFRFKLNLRKPRNYFLVYLRSLLLIN